MSHTQPGLDLLSDWYSSKEFSDSDGLVTPPYKLTEKIKLRYIYTAANTTEVTRNLLKKINSTVWRVSHGGDQERNRKGWLAYIQWHIAAEVAKVDHQELTHNGDQFPDS